MFKNVFITTLTKNTFFLPKTELPYSCHLTEVL